MSQPEESLRPMLRSVEADLATRLQEACDAGADGDESTGELIRLEETLTLAAQAAKQAVSIRRRLHQVHDEEVS